MLRWEDLVPIGGVMRTHGYEGQLMVSLEDSFTLPENLVFVFLDVDGGPVPFFIEKTAGTKEQPILKLEDVSSGEDAQAFIGKTIYLLKNQTRANESIGLESIIGYELEDLENGVLGPIQATRTIAGKKFFIVFSKNGKEVEIPAEKPILSKISAKEKKVFVKLPDGFLEIFGWEKPG